MSLRQYLEQWLASREGEVADSAWLANELSIKRLDPYVGGITLGELRPDHLRRAYQQLRQRLSASSVRKAHVTLNLALKRAVQDGLLARNVAALVTPPRPERSEQHPLTPAQVTALLCYVAAESLGPLIALALYSGLREGELLGLQWGDVGLVAPNSITVQRALVIDKDRRPRLQAFPKSFACLRTVPLPPAAMAAIETQRSWQREQRRRAGRLWREYDLIFPSAVGMPMQASNLIRRFNRLKAPDLAREWSGLHPDTTLHDLRHTYASSLLTAGRPLTEVSHLLGHSSVAVTARIYAHLLPRSGPGAAEELARYYASGAGGNSEELSGTDQGISGAVVSS
jgi:integrase